MACGKAPPWVRFVFRVPCSESVSPSTRTNGEAISRAPLFVRFSFVFRVRVTLDKNEFIYRQSPAAYVYAEWEMRHTTPSLLRDSLN